MITMQSYSQGNKNSLMADIGQDDSILIIGRGSDESKLNEIFKPSSIWEMENIYGDSELTMAYTEAKRNGANNVFVMNCFKTTDFVDSIQYVRHYNFSYIVPIGIKLSDKFYSSEQDREVYFAEHYLNEFSKFTNSLIIFTDEHADLYENINSYLYDMRTKVENFKETTYYLLSNYGRNFAFCLNNLQYKDYSNVILATALSRTKPGSYPETIKNKAIFDLDSEDIFTPEIIYFKNNLHTDTSIENLKNFRTILDANKLISIDRVIKNIERTLDTSFVLGKLYNQYVEMMLHDYLDSFFRRLLETVIRNYCINNIQFVRSEAMSGYITVDIDIHPINSLEQINTLLEVK